MIRIILVALLFVCNLAEAKSIKLGNFSDKDLVFKKETIKKSENCIVDTDCASGLCSRGKCETCNATNICSQGKVCHNGICLTHKPCTKNEDCNLGFCDENTKECVECANDSQCQTDELKSRKCTNNKCINCEPTDLSCGRCGNGYKPDGSGGCACSDDSFKHLNLCKKFCDHTECANEKTPEFNGTNGCCCISK